MADEASPSGEPFNLDQLKELMELMDKHGLTDVHLRQKDQQWRLRRGGHEAPQVIAAPPAYAPAPLAPAPAPAPAAAAPAPAAEAAPAAPASNLHEIKSPMVGTAYHAASPDDPPFVSVGATVQPDTVVCLVEAMKVFEQITADCSGTIEEILVNNGDPVDVGKPLFRVKPA